MIPTTRSISQPHDHRFYFPVFHISKAIHYMPRQMVWISETGSSKCITLKSNKTHSSSEIKDPSCYHRKYPKMNVSVASTHLHLVKTLPSPAWTQLCISTKSPCSGIRTTISIRYQTPVSRRGAWSRSAGRLWTNLGSSVAWACIIIRSGRWQTPAPWCQPLLMGHVATILWTKPRPKSLANSRTLTHRTSALWSALTAVHSMPTISNWAAWNTPASIPIVSVSIHEIVERSSLLQF